MTVFLKLFLSVLATFFQLARSLVTSPKQSSQEYLITDIFYSHFELITIFLLLFKEKDKGKAWLLHLVTDTAGRQLHNMKSIPIDPQQKRYHGVSRG